MARAEEHLVLELIGLVGGPLALAGAGARPIAASVGCRWLAGDPVSEAENLTREARAARSVGGGNKKKR